MNKGHNMHNRERRIRAAGLAVTTAMLVAVALMWSWNTLAADMFSAPRAGLRHAVAFELALLVSGRLMARGMTAHRTT